jgi:hypothetical protein
LTSLRRTGPRDRARPRRPFQHATAPARRRGGHQCAARAVASASHPPPHASTGSPPLCPSGPVHRAATPTRVDPLTG